MTTYKTRFGDIIEAESSDEDEVPDIPVREKLGSSIYLARITSSGKVIWKEAIGSVGDASAAKESEENKTQKHGTKLPCLAYRSMLPSCPTQPPIRSPSWTRRSMRRILKEASFAASNNNSPAIRFPILAYRFLDSPLDSSPLVEGLSLHVEPSSHLVNESDDSKWALYYGAKQMAVDDAEASLFFRLLDESNGQDFLAFVLQVLLKVDKEMGYFQSLGDDDKIEAPVEQLWIPIPMALQLTSKLFSSSDCTKITEMILDLAVDDSTTKRGGDDEDEDGTATVGIDGADGKAEKLRIDLFKWIVLVLAREYGDELSVRHSLARLLFDTASTGTLTSYIPRLADDAADCMCMDAHGETEKQQCKVQVNFSQFESIMHVLWESISEEETAELYRMAYKAQQCIDTKAAAGTATTYPPDGVSFDAFLQAADERRFFTRSRRSPIA